MGIELVSFDAHAGYKEVLLSWLTEAEFDNYKFLLARRTSMGDGLRSSYRQSSKGYRFEKMAHPRSESRNEYRNQESDDEACDWEIIGEVAGKGVGARYTYIDSLVEGGVTYWYLLGDIDGSGDTTWHYDMIRQATPKCYKIFKFALYPPYPSPFNVRTTIKYTVPGKLPTTYKLPTTLKIYDLSGRLVRTLVDEEKNPGEYIVEWDGRSDYGKHLPHGVYFTKLRCGNKSATKKVLLIK